MATVSGQAIREELVRWGIITLLGQATATGAVAYLTDTTRLQSSAWASTAFDGAYVRASAAGGVADGEQTRVDYLDTVNGRLYVTPDWTSAPTNAVTYEIYMPGVDPDDVDRARDEALTSICSQWYLHPLSELPNAGYVDTLAATNWQLINSATIAKQTMSFPQEFARDSLLVTNSGANGAAESASIYPRPGADFYLWVPVSARTGTAQVIVRDVTGGANITLGGTATVTGRGWTAIEVTGNIPTDCYEITVRLTGQGASDIVEWGPINFHWQNQQRIGLPARVISREWVGPVQALHNPSIVDETWGQDQMTEVQGVRAEQVADNVQLRFDHPLENRPYFYTERSYYDALSATYLTATARATGDAATTLCPDDYVVPAMVALLAGQYRKKQPWAQAFWDDLLAQASIELAAKERLYGPKPKARLERARLIRVPQLRV
jgi:hypothetical protein